MAHQQGQALVLALTLLVIGVVTLLVMYNTSQVTVEKSRLVNAADAAAYSGALYVARNLNFMAYTNRALIANHVAVGHFVSYMSWMRYVQSTSRRLSQLSLLAAAIPGVGPVLAYAGQVLDRWAEVTTRGTELFGEVYVPLADSLNRIISAVQMTSRASLGTSLDGGQALAGIHGLMEAAARAHHPAIRINVPETMEDAGSARYAGEIAVENAALSRFMRFYRAGDDGGRMERMTDLNLGHSERWIRSREWRPRDLSVPFLIRVRKQGSTRQRLGDGLSDWNASDELLHWRWSWSKMEWKRKGSIGKGRASAREFDDTYAGIDTYAGLTDGREGRDPSLSLTAYATLPVDNIDTQSQFGLAPGTRRLAAVARARIYHRRPAAPDFAPLGRGEYANLYNPFWTVRMEAVPWR